DRPSVSSSDRRALERLVDLVQCPISSTTIRRPEARQLVHRTVPFVQDPEDVKVTLATHGLTLEHQRFTRRRPLVHETPTPEGAPSQRGHLRVRSKGGRVLHGPKLFGLSGCAPPC